MGRFRKLKTLPSWRRISLHAWKPPRDPTVYGTLEVDVSKALEWLERTREESGVKVTLTHLVGKALAMAIAERPDVNAVVRRRRHIYVRDTIDIFFQVAFEGGEDLSGAKVSQADTKSVVEIARELGERAERVRAKKEREIAKGRTMIEKMPAVMRRPTLDLASWLTYDLGLDLRRAGIPYDSFGSAMVTNVGTFGLPSGFAPLVPFARTPILLTVGAVQPRPVAVGDRVEVRPMLTIGGTFDHRVLDGYQAGKLAARFRAIMESPDEHLPGG